MVSRSLWNARSWRDVSHVHVSVDSSRFSPHIGRGKSSSGQACQWERLGQIREKAALPRKAPVQREVHLPNPEVASYQHTRTTPGWGRLPEDDYVRRAVDRGHRIPFKRRFQKQGFHQPCSGKIDQQNVMVRVGAHDNINFHGRQSRGDQNADGARSKTFEQGCAEEQNALRGQPSGRIGRGTRQQKCLLATWARKYIKGRMDITCCG